MKTFAQQCNTLLTENICCFMCSIFCASFIFNIQTQKYYLKTNVSID